MHSTVVKGHKAEAHFSFESTDNLFTSDYVIDAFIKGISYGESNAERNFTELLNRNLRDTNKFLYVIVKELDQLNVDINNIYFKLGQWPEISILITVSEADYLKHEFSTIYDKIFLLEKEYNNPSLEIGLSFLSLNKDFNESKVSS